jgi:hypothetical protein
VTDSEEKNGAPKSGGVPEEDDGLKKSGPSESAGTPSTVEKAVAKVSKDRKAEADAKAAAKTAPKTGDTKTQQKAANQGKPPTGQSGRSLRGSVIGLLSVLVLIAVAYVARPLWMPVLPGWMQASPATVPAGGSEFGVVAQVSRFAARIEPLERDISNLKARFAAQSVADPARLLALDDLVKRNGRRLVALRTEISSLGRSTRNGVSEDQIADLTRRLQGMEKQLLIFATRSSSAASAAGPDATAAINALDALRTQSSERMSALERENNALRDIVAMLDKRVGAIEQKPDPVAGTARSNALLLAVGQLREAGRGTESFAVALQAVQALAEAQEIFDRPLATLKSHAETGVPNLIALRLHFDRIAGRIAHESFVPKGDGWVDRTLGSISRVFTFRRTGTEAALSDDENGRIARAELHLAAGDLRAAVTILEGLQEPGLSYATPWLKEARARLDVDASIKELFSQALANAQTATDGKGAPGG